MSFLTSWNFADQTDSANSVRTHAVLWLNIKSHVTVSFHPSNCYGMLAHNRVLCNLFCSFRAVLQWIVKRVCWETSSQHTLVFGSNEQAQRGQG